MHIRYTTWQHRFVLPVWLLWVFRVAWALRSLLRCASAWPEPFPGFLSARHIEHFLAATAATHTTPTHYKAVRRYVEDDTTDRVKLTKHRMAKMKSGMVERPSSHRQPRVGMTRMAKRTSKTVPTAQNIWKSEIHIWNTSKNTTLYRYIASRFIRTSINKMHVALDFMGRNSAYSVTLTSKVIS